MASRLAADAQSAWDSEEPVSVPKIGPKLPTGQGKSRVSGIRRLNVEDEECEGDEIGPAFRPRKRKVQVRENEKLKANYTEPSVPDPDVQGTDAESKRWNALRAQYKADKGKPQVTTPVQVAKRDEWMMVPPTQSDWESMAISEKVRGRTFNSGKIGKAAGEAVDSSAWTESEAQRQERLRNEAFGLKSKTTKDEMSKKDQTPDKQSSNESSAYKVSDLISEGRLSILDPQC